jgi:hypothetical protein
LKYQEMMTREHPRWEEFCDRLEGPEGCNFHEDDGDGEIHWKCEHDDLTLSRRILADMGLSKTAIEDSVTYFRERGGYCDCEVLFNVKRGVPPYYGARYQ